MTSILSNLSAMSALQAIKSVSSALNQTQSEVSSGLRVATAQDNVAYWSISTTMNSDNRAISATSDALGVGAAKVSTAYTATDVVVDVLSEFKATLVTAKEDSTDRAKIQHALQQLNDQANNIVESASFSGKNWLKTSASEHINDVSKLSDYVVESFTRDPAGTTSLNTTEVDLRRTSMLNAGGGGILQKDILDYYMPLGSMYTSSFYHEGHEDHAFSGPMTFDTTDAVTFDLTVDASTISAGESFAITIDKSVIDDALSTTDGVIRNANDLRLVLVQAFANAGAGTYVDPYGSQAISSSSPTRYEIRSLETSPHVGSSIAITNIFSSFGPTVDERTLGLDSSSLIDHDNMITSSAMNFIQPFKVLLDATISFDLSIDNNPLTTYVITRDVIDAALGTTDGRVNNADDLKTIVDYLAAADGLAVTTSGDRMTFQADQDDYPGYGNKAVDFYISEFRPNPPYTLRFDLAEIDVTADTFTIDEYVEGVEFMLQQSIDSASLLGAVQQRIDLQTDFASKLMDSIESGVSRLVDADMEEASARLQALQTQKQLSVQSLQIANSLPQNIMSLFS